MMQKVGDFQPEGSNPPCASSATGLRRLAAKSPRLTAPEAIQTGDRTRRACCIVALRHGWVETK